MSTADISMDYSSVKTLAVQVKAMQEDFDTMCTDLCWLVDSVSNSWEGKAQVEFSAAYSKLARKLNIISEVLGQYAKELNNAIIAEAETETVNAKMLKETSFR